MHGLSFGNVQQIPPLSSGADVEPKRPSVDSMDDKQLIKIRTEASKQFDSARGSHDWEHTLRVARLSEAIGNSEGADMLVLKTAAYLHDIGRCRQDNSRGHLCHAEEGARLALPLVQAMNISPARRENILHCIRSHRFRKDPIPQTLEAKVLFDADKLDAIGAVGVARAFLFAGELGACLHNPNLLPEESEPYSRNDTGYREYIVKLRKIKARMLTVKGKAMAKQRHLFMDTFFNRFLEEYEGKR